MSARRGRGFTLVELLVAMVIGLMVLVPLAVYTVGKMRQRQHVTQATFFLLEKLEAQRARSLAQQSGAGVTLGPGNQVALFARSDRGTVAAVPPEAVRIPAELRDAVGEVSVRVLRRDAREGLPPAENPVDLPLAICFPNKPWNPVYVGPDAPLEEGSRLVVVVEGSALAKGIVIHPTGKTEVETR